MIGLTRRGLTRGAYIGILAAYLEIFTEAEARRSRHGLPDDLTLANAIANLEQDLASLRHSTPANAHIPLASILTRAHALGMLYVLMGAQFGGAVIAKSLQRHHPNLPRTFFAGTSNPAQWRGLLGLLEASPVSQHAAILAGAERTFADVGRVVSRSCAEQRGG
ncbi:MAG: biliverdin-producing heme oxygenase [Pseudomonadota bacterium]